MKSLFVLIFVLVAGFPLAMFGGVVLHDLWRWFIIPVFPEAPLITMAQAVGLSYVAGFFKIGLASSTTDDKEWTAGLTAFFGVAIAYCILWAFAAIWHAIFF